MDDFSKYYADTPIEEPDLTTNSDNDSENNIKQENDRIIIDTDKIKEFCEKLTGVDEFGQTRAIASYQYYNYFPGETDPKADVIYNLNRAHVDITYDELNPQFITLDIVFKTYDDPELKLMWARLNKWRKDNGDMPIFLIHLLEMGSISLQTDENETLLEADIFNPLLQYLTRETPTMEAVEETNDKGEIIGGNIIRMLCPIDLVTFTVTDSFDTKDIKAEVLREEEEKRYINEQSYSDGSGNFI